MTATMLVYMPRALLSVLGGLYAIRRLVKKEEEKSINVEETVMRVQTLADLQKNPLYKYRLKHRIEDLWETIKEKIKGGK